MKTEHIHNHIHFSIYLFGMDSSEVDWLDEPDAQTCPVKVIGAPAEQGRAPRKPRKPTSISTSLLMAVRSTARKLERLRPNRKEAKRRIRLLNAHARRRKAR